MSACCSSPATPLKQACSRPCNHHRSEHRPLSSCSHTSQNKFPPHLQRPPFLRPETEVCVVRGGGWMCSASLDFPELSALLKLIQLPSPVCPCEPLCLSLSLEQGLLILQGMVSQVPRAKCRQGNISGHVSILLEGARLTSLFI